MEAPNEDRTWQLLRLATFSLYIVHVFYPFPKSGWRSAQRGLYFSCCELDVGPTWAWFESGESSMWKVEAPDQPHLAEGILIETPK